jgi:uncharacterized protein (DUF433 family)
MSQMLSTVPRRQIVSTADIMGGKPCVSGTRITVEVILRRFAEGYSVAEVLSDYPILTEHDVQIALEYAAGLAAHPPLEVA